MREILFRGQTRRYGEKTLNVRGDKMPSNWVYGGIFPSHNGSRAIIYQQEPTIEKFTVYADTVGQFTGLTDKNGTRIFEGDIVNYNGTKHEVVFETRFSAYFGIKISHIETWQFCLEVPAKLMEVIGNIHDNPELLNPAGGDNGNATQNGLLPAT